MSFACIADTGGKAKRLLRIPDAEFYALASDTTEDAYNRNSTESIKANVTSNITDSSSLDNLKVDVNHAHAKHNRQPFAMPIE